jgi:hypothetical protein
LLVGITMSCHVAMNEVSHIVKRLKSQRGDNRKIE